MEFVIKKSKKKGGGKSGGGRADSGADDGVAGDGMVGGQSPKRKPGAIDRKRGKAAGITVKGEDGKGKKEAGKEDQAGGISEAKVAGEREQKKVAAKERPQTLREPTLEEVAGEEEETDGGEAVLETEKGRLTGEKKGETPEDPSPPHLTGPPPGGGVTQLDIVVEQKKAVNSPLYIEQVDTEKERKKLKVLPGLVCNTCGIGPECPEYKPDYVCNYEAAFKAFPTRSQESVLELMGEIVDENKRRLRFGLLHERIVNGGKPESDVTRLSETVMTQAGKLLELHREVNRVTVSVKAPTVIVDSKTGETVPNPAVGGILSKLFAPSAPPPSPLQTVEVITLPESGDRAVAAVPGGEGDVEAVFQGLDRTLPPDDSERSEEMRQDPTDTGSQG